MSYTKRTKGTTQKPIKDNGPSLADCKAQFEADQKACDKTFGAGTIESGLCHAAAHEGFKGCLRGVFSGESSAGTTKA